MHITQIKLLLFITTIFSFGLLFLSISELFTQKLLYFYQMSSSSFLYRSSSNVISAKKKKTGTWKEFFFFETEL